MLRIDRDPDPGKLLWFSLFWFPAFWGVVGYLVWSRLGWQEVSLLLWAVAAVLAVLGAAVRPVARRIYLGTMLATYPIGWVLAHVILAIIFYGIVTPLGMVARMVGRDPLERRFDRQAASYWTERRQAENRSRYFRQF